MKNLGSINDAKSVLTKEYGDSNYASNSEIAALKESVRVANLLADEANFKAEANFRAYKYGFKYLCIEPLHNTNDIDTTKDDGESVVNTYYNSTEHLINKTSSDTLTIQSKNFELDKNPTYALVLIDYEGSGSVNIYFSKNDGIDWTSLSNDTLTSITVLVQKDVRVKLELVGNVILKNIAWGCK